MTVLLLFLAVAVASTANAAWLLGRMKAAHSEVWMALGRPTLSQSNLARPRLALLKYVWSFRFREVNDRMFVLACWAALVAEVALAALFFVFTFAPHDHV